MAWSSVDSSDGASADWATVRRPHGLRPRQLERAQAAQQAERLVRATAELDGERRRGATGFDCVSRRNRHCATRSPQCRGALRANNQSFLQLAKASLSEFQKQAGGQPRAPGAGAADSTRAGGWGEVQLRRVVELAGMLDHCDFSEKTTVHTTDSKLVPDMVVNLPGGRNIVVDAKVPYGAYREAAEAEQDAERAAKLREHAGQVRAHMVQRGIAA